MFEYFKRKIAHKNRENNQEQANRTAAGSQAPASQQIEIAEEAEVAQEKWRRYADWQEEKDRYEYRDYGSSYPLSRENEYSYNSLISKLLNEPDEQIDQVQARLAANQMEQQRIQEEIRRLQL